MKSTQKQSSAWLLLPLAVLLLNGCQTTSETDDAQPPAVAKMAPAKKKAVDPSPIVAEVKPVKVAEPVAKSKPVVVAVPKPMAQPKPVVKSQKVVSLLVDFSGKKGKQTPPSAADFKAGDERVLDGTPVNSVQSSKAKNFELEALGASGIKLTSKFANGPFNTGKGSWKGKPILSGYLFTPRKLSAEAHPVLQLTGLSEIPEGALVSLTVWGVGDTADSDSIFELVYNGSSFGKLSTDYDSTVDATRVQFNFKKAAGANELTVNWAKAG